jgi:DNA gyrase subunit A
MHNTLLLFSEKGKCFWLKVYEIPEGTKTSKGRAIQNVINIEQDDKILAYINVNNLTDPEYINNNYIILCTKKGIIKKTSLEAYSRPRQNGVNAITIREDDQLFEARMTNGNHHIMMAVRSGKAVRFEDSSVRPIGRTASGVRGITLGHDLDEVVGMVCVENENEDILVVSENGYGKRSKIGDYRLTNRGGKGVKTINVTEKTGQVISIKSVDDTNDLMIITQSGLTIRMSISALRILGRTAQGVRLINLKEGDQIASITIVPTSEDEDEMPLILDENVEISDDSNSQPEE